MNASEQATGLVLQNSIEELRNGLAQIGVSCGTLELGYNQDDQPAKDRENHRYSREKEHGRQEDEDTGTAFLASVAPYSSVYGSGGRINVSA